MTSDEVYKIIMDVINELKPKISDNSNNINKIYVIIGKMGVKLGFIVGTFSLVGTTLGVILVKYVFKF